MLLWQYPFMVNALALCVLLAISLSSFGHHVVRRGVLFVDLALAQMAALGASLGLALGWEHNPIAQFALTLLFTFAAAGLFAWFRTRQNIPIEALIGITYAGSMALSLLILERSATGTEEMKEMLMGSILTVSSHQVLFCLIASSLSLGSLFWARQSIEHITQDARSAHHQGRHVLWWDFFFYAAFGLMVTVAVNTAGVLLVFAFLIIPSLFGLMFGVSPFQSQIIAWGFGILACLLGLEMSIRWDMSAGPTLVVTLVVLLCLGGLLRGRWRFGKRPIADSQNQSPGPHRRSQDSKEIN